MKRTTFRPLTALAAVAALIAPFANDAVAEKLCANGATTTSTWTFDNAKRVSGAGCFLGTDCQGSASYTCTGGSWSMNTGSLTHSCNTWTKVDCSTVRTTTPLPGGRGDVMDLPLGPNAAGTRNIDALALGGNVTVDGRGVQATQVLDPQGRLLMGVSGPVSFDLAPRQAVTVQVYAGTAGAQAVVTLTRR